MSQEDVKVARNTELVPLSVIAANTSKYEVK